MQQEAINFGPLILHSFYIFEVLTSYMLMGILGGITPIRSHPPPLSTPDLRNSLSLLPFNLLEYRYE